MRKYLIGAAILAVIALGGTWWLGTQAEKGKPPAGEIRIPVENVLG